MFFFRMKCPHESCGVMLSIPRDQEGQTVRCGGCGRTFKAIRKGAAESRASQQSRKRAA